MSFEYALIYMNISNCVRILNIPESAKIYISQLLRCEYGWIWVGIAFLNKLGFKESWVYLNTSCSANNMSQYGWNRMFLNMLGFLKYALRRINMTE